MNGPSLIQHGVPMLAIIQQLLEFIGSNLDRELSADQLAKFARLSRSRLHYLFRIELGITANQYVRLRRFERARDLLKETSLSVKEIRAQVGVNDRSHFAREFKKSYGVTPSQFRKLRS